MCEQVTILIVFFSKIVVEFQNELLSLSDM